MSLPSTVRPGEPPTGPTHLPLLRPTGLAVSLLGAGLLGAGAALAAPAAAGLPAQAARLNDTGQTQCLYVNNSDTGPCTGEGQDGDAGRDLRKPSDADGVAGFSFAKVGSLGQALPADAGEWSCVQDRVTGLTWEVKTADGGLRDKNKLYTNHGDGRTGDATEFVQQVNAAGLCGHNDWRLPSRVELQGLVNFGQGFPGPAIDLAWFPNSRGTAYESPAGGYWTGTPYLFTAASDPRAWNVHFLTGYTTGLPTNSQQSVRLVRGAQAEAGRRFVARQGEVLDTQTRLIWRRCSEGQAWDAVSRSCTGKARGFTWSGSFARARAVADATGQAWRVPNVKEMASLADDRRYNPAIDPEFFPNTPVRTYWTASYGAYFLPETWFVYSGDGYNDLSYATFDYALRLVRDAER